MRSFAVALGVAGACHRPAPPAPPRELAPLLEIVEIVGRRELSAEDARAALAASGDPAVQGATLAVWGKGGPGFPTGEPKCVGLALPTPVSLATLDAALGPHEVEPRLHYDAPTSWSWAPDGGRCRAVCTLVVGTVTERGVTSFDVCRDARR